MSGANRTETRTSRNDNMFDLRKTDANPTESAEQERALMSQITPGKKRYVKHRLCEANPTIWIGKGGPSDELHREICKQLEKNESVKVKVLQSALANGTTRRIASTIAAQTSSILVEVRGHTFILYKHRGK